MQCVSEGIAARSVVEIAVEIAENFSLSPSALIFSISAQS